MSWPSFEPTEEQDAIIYHDGSAFITACPGAGKTQVMAERARHLFENMPLGRGVAFLSFTRQAIFELEKRLQTESVLPNRIFPSFLGTFDSFVWQFLVAPFGIKGSEANPRLVADVSEISVAPYDGAHSLPLSCFCPETGMIFEQAAKSRGFNVSQKLSSHIKAYETAAAKTRKNLRERGQLGFDEARDVALDRLKDSILAERIANALSGRFIEVIVDEAQDCNPDDLMIVSWLRDSGLTVKVVCDPNQSIYKFRGGVTDHLHEFADSFPVENRKNLTGNFRSTPNICKAIAQFRPQSVRGEPDDALGPLKASTTPVRILSYKGQSVPASIGTTFYNLLKEENIEVASSPIVAATKASGAAAVGQPQPKKSNHRTIRLAEAVTGFQFAAGFNEIKSAVDGAHQVLLEIEGHLDQCTYRQYLAEHELDIAEWRSQVISILDELRFDPAKHSDAREWHAAAKKLLSRELSIGGGESISQKLKWNNNLDEALAVVPSTTAKPRTIHSVKGTEYPAVCAVATAPTLKGILDFLDTGEPANKAEEARKLYVATSRAEQLLVIAAPSSQAERLKAHLGFQGANVTILKI